MAQVGNVIFQISADLKGLQGQLRTMEGNFNTSFGKIEAVAKNFGKGILQGLVGGLSVGALAGFTKEILNLADSLQNLSDQTGLSVETLSGIKSTVEEAGSSLDAFGRGVFNLQKNLGNLDADDTDKVAASIKRLGLNLNDLRNSTPDQFIQKVTDALVKIENPIERNTLQFNLLNKSAKELGPVFTALTGRFEELRSKGLSAADVKLLDDVGDALTRLKNAALLLGAEGAAGLLRFFGVFDQRGKIVDSLIRTEDEIKRIDDMLARRQSIRQSGFGFLTGKDDKAQLDRRAELVEQQKALDKQINALNAPRNQDPYKGIGDSAKKAKKEVDELKRVMESIAEQNIRLKEKLIELTQGKEAAEEFALKQQELKESAKGLTPEIVREQQERRFLTERIREQAEAYARLKAAVDATRGDPSITEDIRFGLTPDERSQALESNDEMQRSAIENIKALEAQLTSDLLTESERRIAIVNKEYQERVDLITRTAAAAGKNEEQITALLAQAAQARTQALQQNSDQLTTFQTRAFERMHDALADITKDALSGQIRSWEDLGNRVKQVIDSIVSDFLAMQLKIALMGNQYGQQGGQMGGLLGSLFGMFGGGGATSSIGGAFNVEELIWGAMAVAHEGGPIHHGAVGLPRRAIKMHSGGEVPIMAQSGEYMFDKWSAGRIGRPMLDYMRSTGNVPGGNGQVYMPITINATDAGSFHRSKRATANQMRAALTRTQS